MPRRLKLREYRERKLLTQQMLSEKTGLRLASISRIESGLQVPRVGTVRILAAALGVEPDELIDWEASAQDDDMGKAAA